MVGCVWVLKNRRVPRKSDKSAFMEPSQSLSPCWASSTQITVAITKVESTSSTFMLGLLIVYHGTTNLVGQSRESQIRERRTHLTTTSRKRDIVGETRQLASAVRVTHVTTHGFRKPPTRCVSEDAELFHQDVHRMNPKNMSGHVIAMVCYFLFFSFSLHLHVTSRMLT